MRSAAAGSDRDADPLSNVKPMRGGPEYRELDRALQHAEPGCRDNDAFTADRLDDDERAELARICAVCPVRPLCERFAAVAKPTVGYWPTAQVLSAAS